MLALFCAAVGEYASDGSHATKPTETDLDRAPQAVGAIYP
jgi:hypothetical protein